MYNLLSLKEKNLENSSSDFEFSEIFGFVPVKDLSVAIASLTTRPVKNRLA
jgi:hypothetical protein